MAITPLPEKSQESTDSISSLITGENISVEVYRRLYVSLDLPPDSYPVIGITSPIAGEGRSSVSLGLALTLANDLDGIVALVEVDLERPSLADRLGISASPGLSEVLRGDKPFEAAMHRAADSLYVVPAGVVPPDASGLLRELPLRDPFHGPQAIANVVVLDLPPILNHSYGPLAAGVADALVLVVRAGVTPVGVIREAISRLEDRPPRGVVLNGPRSSLPSWWPEHGN